MARTSARGVKRTRKSFRRGGDAAGGAVCRWRGSGQRGEGNVPPAGCSRARVQYDRSNVLLEQAVAVPFGNLAERSSVSFCLRLSHVAC